MKILGIDWSYLATETHNDTHKYIQQLYWQLRIFYFTILFLSFDSPITHLMEKNDVINKNMP